MSTTATGISKDTVTSDQQAPLGFKLSVPTANGGMQVYTYVKSTINVLQGTCLMKAGNDYSACVASIVDHAMRAVGVAQQANELDPASTSTDWAIPANYYAFVLTEGYGTVKTGQSSAANSQLVLYGTGLVSGGTAASATNGPVGHVGAAAVNTTTGTGYVKFSG